MAHERKTPKNLDFIRFFGVFAPQIFKRRVGAACHRAFYGGREQAQKEGRDPGFTIPAELKAQYSSVLGWCAKAVDSLADRLVFREFENDNFDLNGIYNFNNPDVLFDSAILSALISSCCFIYISPDDDGFPRLQVIDGGNATGIIDSITGLLTEGYAVLKRDNDTKAPILEAYFVPGRTDYIRKGISGIERCAHQDPTGIPGLSYRG